MASFLFFFFHLPFPSALEPLRDPPTMMNCCCFCVDLDCLERAGKDHPDRGTSVLVTRVTLSSSMATERAGGA